METSARRVAIVCALFIGGAFATACSVLVGFDGFTGGNADAAAPSDATADVVLDASGVTNGDGGTGSDARADAGKNVDASCPVGRGPTMVAIPDDAGHPIYCVDSTEVTSTEYGKFFDTVSDLSTLPAACSFKTSYTSISSPGDIPANVDWCDAFAFCAWSGKRLCGKIGGGSNDFADFASLSSQWFYACSVRGAQGYPYGDTFQPGICNDTYADAGGPVPAGSMPGCVGGFPGIFDMAGNMWEWEDSCTGDSGANDQCRVRGGTWVDGDPVTRCDYDYLNHFDPRRSNPDGYMGIRCCADL